MHYAHPIIAGMCACLAYVMVKCCKAEDNYVLTHLLYIFFSTLIISVLIYIFYCTMQVYEVLQIILLPFIPAIYLEITPQGLIGLHPESDTPGGASPTKPSDAGSSSPTGTSGSLTTAEYLASEYAKVAKLPDAILSMTAVSRELKTAAVRLNYFILQMANVQAENNVIVIQDSTGFISLDVPVNMTEEKQNSLVKRVRIIATAFEDKCLDYEETGKKSLARIQEYRDIGGF